jgi:hypothetical protein
MMFGSALFRHLAQNPQAPAMRPMNAPMGAPAPGGLGTSQGGLVPGSGSGPFGMSGLGGLLAKRKANQEANNPKLPHFDEDRQRTQGLLDGIGAPGAGQEWGGLIDQLGRQSRGEGPSLAEQQYQAAQQDTTGALSSMGRGSASPAAARQALIQRGRVGQGMAQGVAMARTNEQMQASQALTSALGTRDQINSGAYLDILGAQLGLSRAQLEALTGNADRKSRDADSKRQASAAKFNAVAGGLGGLGGLF